VSAETDRRQRGPGWIATLAGGGLLIAVGFAVGLMAGAVYEEPGLVVEQVRGRTTEVPLPAGATPASDASAAPAPNAIASAAPAPPPVSTAPPAGGFAVQVGAFATAPAAEGLAAELRGMGQAAYVSDEGGSGARYKVRVGPIATRAQADALADKLKREQRLPTWVLVRDAR
jgi:cell division septation protein DedD